MNKLEFISEVKRRFPEYQEVKNGRNVSLVKYSKPRITVDHSKNLINEIGKSLEIKEKSGKILCDIKPIGIIKYFEDGLWENLFNPIIYTVNSYDTLLDRLTVDKEIIEL